MTRGRHLRFDHLNALGPGIERLLREEWRPLFRRTLDELPAGAQPPTVRSATMRVFHGMGRLRCEVVVTFQPQHAFECIRGNEHITQEAVAVTRHDSVLHVPWEYARGVSLPRDAAIDLTWPASLMFGEMAEDWRVRSMCAAQEAALLEAVRANAPQMQIQQLAMTLATMQEHARRYHRDSQMAAVSRVDERRTATEVRLRRAEQVLRLGHEMRGIGDLTAEQARLAQDHLQRAIYEREMAIFRIPGFGYNDWYDNSYTFTVHGFDGYEPGSEEARERGMALMRAHLTPDQWGQYESTKSFDVVGGKSGKTYRISHGRQMNIHELDKKGRKKQGWCFLPSGGLVTGDVMVGQKYALELYEEEALKKANPFDGPLRCNPRSAPRYDYTGYITIRPT
jgi:hypothetical protein